MTHEEWQAQVVQLGQMMGWTHLHVRKSIGKGKKWTTTTNIKGWPDLQFMRPPGEIIWVEIKVGKDKPSDDQVETLAFLNKFDPKIGQAYVWYPEDLDEAMRVLSRRPGR